MKTIIIALVIAISLTFTRILEGSLGYYDSGVLDSGISKDSLLDSFIKFFLFYIFIVYYTMKKSINKLKLVIIISLIPALLIGFVVLSDIERHPYDNPFFLIINYMAVLWTPSVAIGYIIHILYNYFGTDAKNREDT